MITNNLSSPDSITSRLRAHIWDEHQILENLPFSQALIQETLPWSLYVGQLEALLPIYRTLERKCQANLEHAVMRTLWQENMAKTTWLLEDLVYFKYAEIPAPPVQRAIIAWLHPLDQATLWQLVGVLYVMEGSTLGNQFLLPHLRRHFSLSDQGIRYYTGYGEATQSHWQEFKNRLNQTLTDSEAQTQVMEAALSTVSSMKNLLTALWQSET